MGKKVKKSARSGQKDKRVVTSPKVIAQKGNGVTRLTTTSLKVEAEVGNFGAEVVDDKASVVKERRKCPHLDKSLEVDKVSSKLSSGEAFKCEDCREGAADRKTGKGKGKHGKKKGSCSAESKAESKAIWVCLECGHYSCGGVGLPTSPQCHALRHAKQSRHSVVIQVENPHLRWCFPCSTLIPVEKAELPGEQKDILSEIVKLIKRPSCKGAQVTVEDVWFGSGSVVSDIKSTNIESNRVGGSDFYAARGLVNLGNTCFFNSVMQNLLAVDILRKHLLNLDESIGPLTGALRKIFLETSPETGARNVINPRSLFGCICAKAPQFRGYQQQDSHELLRCLLDGLSSEVLISKKFENDSLVNDKSGSVTFVDAIFGGQLSSIVCCVECGHSSVVYEPFLDLSLPVPTKKPAPKKTQPVSRSRKTKLPPKRGARSRQKTGKDGDVMPQPIVSNASITDDLSRKVDCGPLAGDGSDVSVTDCSSVHMMDSCDRVDANGSISQSSELATGKEHETVQENRDATHNAAASDGSTWLDFLEPPSASDAAAENDCTWLDFLEPTPLSCDQNFPVEFADVSPTQDIRNINFEAYQDNDTAPDTTKSGNQGHVQHGEPDPRSTSLVNYEDEFPMQIQDSMVLLLPYKEDVPATGEIKRVDQASSSAMDVGGEIKKDDQASSSTIDGGGGSLDFDGFGDLFNEPEVVAGPNLEPSSSRDLENGLLTGNICESDPDEVDNTDSPVSVESCLSYFTKPELLAGEHAWHCENCAKLLLEKRRKSKKNQLKGKSLQQNDVQGDESYSSNVGELCNGQLGGQLVEDNYPHVVAAENGGISDLDHNLDKNGTDQRGCNLMKPTGREANCRLKNGHSDTSNGCVCAGTFDEAGSSNKVADSGSVSCTHFAACDSEKASDLEEDCDSAESAGGEIKLKSMKVMRNATKRMLISKAPPVMTFHLKRFSQDARGRLSKLNGHVVFGEMIDVGPFMNSRSVEKEECIYRLIGVVEHQGSMRGGHYVAYVRGDIIRGKGDDDNEHSVWYHASDAYVRETSLEEVLRCEAYILFYQKI